MAIAKNKKRVFITLSLKLLSLLEEIAANKGITKSEAISDLLNAEQKRGQEHE